MPDSFAAAYRAAQQLAGGACPIEAGLLGRLVDLECRHGRMPGDSSPPCGCWPQENTAEPEAAPTPGAAAGA